MSNEPDYKDILKRLTKAVEEVELSRLIHNGKNPNHAIEGPVWENLERVYYEADDALNYPSPPPYTPSTKDIVMEVLTELCNASDDLNDILGPAMDVVEKKQMNEDYGCGSASITKKNISKVTIEYGI